MAQSRTLRIDKLFLILSYNNENIKQLLAFFATNSWSFLAKKIVMFQIVTACTVFSPSFQYLYR